MVLGRKKTPEIPEKFEKIFQFLLHMKASEENYALALDAFQKYFSSNRDELDDFIVCFRKLLENNSSPFREKLSRRQLNIFSQLFSFFGFYELKIELDDYAFSIEYPQEYIDIKKELKTYQKSSKKILSHIKKELAEQLEDFGDIIVEGRFKNLYSIYKKRKHKKKSDVFDIFAFRIICHNNTQTCYDILTLLHNAYIPDPTRYKDYIAIPKINGYQAIHTGVICRYQNLDLTIEIQIKTQLMHEISLHGTASHTLYSSKKKSKLLSEKEKKLMKYLASQSSQNTDIYVTLKDGSIIVMKKGDTALDCAHKIHSDFSKNIVNVFLHKEEKTLHTNLQNFDILEFITS